MCGCAPTTSWRGQQENNSSNNRFYHSTIRKINPYPIVLLCSANRKVPHPAPALELYRSEFFRLGRSFAQSFSPKKIYILSAEHGLVAGEQELVPYTMTMSALAKEGDVKVWAKLIVDQLREEIDLHQYEVIVLGLRKFAQPIADALPHAQAPLVGMNMPQAMNYLRERFN
ncbi:MAG: DUF6884 domain-containing protein [Bacteroidota bacterium]